MYKDPLSYKDTTLPLFSWDYTYKNPFIHLSWYDVETCIKNLLTFRSYFRHSSFNRCQTDIQFRSVGNTSEPMSTDAFVNEIKDPFEYVYSLTIITRTIDPFTDFVSLDVDIRFDLKPSNFKYPDEGMIIVDGKDVVI